VRWHRAGFHRYWRWKSRSLGGRPQIDAGDAGRAALDAMITRQAQIIAYIDDFKLLMIATLAVIPLLIVFQKRPAGGSEDHTLVME
jgi:hypothetical protein